MDVTRALLASTLLVAMALPSAALAQAPIERLGVDPTRAVIDVREVLSGGPPP
jgi:hypothetical protein